MHTLNASSECCELSWKHNCTLECAAGIKMAALTATSSICICVYTSHKIQKCGNAQIQTDDSHLETLSF